MRHDLFAHETLLRLGLFGAVFVAMAVWEFLTPRRSQAIGRGWRWDGFIDQAHGIVDEQPVFDAAAGRRRRLRGDSRGLHRGAVGNKRVPIDAFQHNRAVRNDCVEVGGSGEALDRPQLLVPAAADDPPRLGVRGAVGAQPLLQVGERARAGEIELQRGKAELGDMPVRVDQPGQQRLAVRIDRRSGFRQASAGRSTRTTLPSLPMSRPVKCCSRPAASAWMPLACSTSASESAGDASSAAISPISGLCIRLA